MLYVSCKRVTVAFFRFETFVGDSSPVRGQIQNFGTEMKQEVFLPTEMFLPSSFMDVGRRIRRRLREVVD